MAIRDHNIDRVRDWLYVPNTAFSGMTASASVHTGVAVEQEISTLGDVGLLMDTAGDMVIGRVLMPNFDPKHDIGVRVHWSSGSSTAADTIDWIVLYDRQVDGDTIIAPATALDTTIAQDTATATANQDQWSPRGAIAKDKFAANIWSSDDGASGIPMVWRFLVEMDAFAAGLTEDKFFLGLLFDYVPRHTRGGGSKVSVRYL